MRGKAFGPGELKQLFLEGVGRIADSAQRDKILEKALEYAGEPCAPEDEQQFAVFVGGPLYHAVEDLMGRDAADSMMSFFDPILNRWLVLSSSGAWRRPSGPGRGNTTRRPIVVVASGDVATSSDVAAALEGRGYVIHTVRDGKAALDRCREYLPCAMIVDASLPGPVDAAKLCKLVRLALAEEAPAFLLLGELDAPPASGIAQQLPKAFEAAELVRALAALAS